MLVQSMLAPGARTGPFEVLAPLGAGGMGEVYGASGGPAHQASARRGAAPRWSRDGREIFFVNGGSLWAAAVRIQPSFAVEMPRELFKLPEDILVDLDFYEVTRDGQGFVMIQKDPFELRPIELVLVPNWIEKLKARMTSAH